jgi:leader peptidase (prepilin peptidase)/N-methyltransferase
MLHPVFELGAALLGACVGSFLNVVVYRLPQADPVRRSLGGRSRCPKCRTQIAWFDNLPLVSWLLLRGKSRCCRQPISLRYPALELLTAGLFFALWRWPRVPILAADAAVPTVLADGLWTFGFLAIFVSLLVACTFIDLDHRILPDVLTLPGIGIGLVASLAAPGLAGYISDEPTVGLEMRSFLASLCGAAVGAGVTWTIRSVASRIFRREAMGLGDVKFLGTIGAFLGWQGALLSLFLGCLSGALIGGLQMLRIRRAVAAGTAAPGADARMIPFGPFLALGAATALFFGEEILIFLFETWPDWQRGTPAAPVIMSVSAVLCLVVLVYLVRRGRGNG